MTRRGAAVAASLLLVLDLRAASADPDASSARTIDLVIEIADCGDLDPAELERIAFLERALLADDTSARSATATVRCRDSHADLTVTARGRALRNTVDLADYPPDSHARVVALALAELVAVAVAAPEHSAPPPPVAPRTAPAERPVLASQARPAMAGQHVGVVARLSALGGERFDGVGIVYVGRLGPLTLTADGYYDHGSRSSPLGHVAMHASGVGAQVGLDRRFGPIGVGAGVGARLGVVRLSGVASMDGVEATSLTAPAGGPLAAAVASIGGRHAFARGGVEVGYLALGLRARIEDQSEDVIDLRGPWLTATASVGLSW